MLVKLKTQHREVARLAFEGSRPVEIADRTGLAVTSVRTILADPLCQAYIDSLNDKADSNIIDVRRRMTEMQEKSLDVIDDILTHEGVSPSTKLKAAHDILDRTGYQPVQRHEHLHAHLTSDDLQKIKDRAKAAGAITHKAVELTQ